MPVTAESLALQAQLDEQVGEVVDAQTRALVAAWAIAWAEVATDLQDALAELLANAAEGFVSATVMARSRRLTGVLSRIHDALDGLAGDVVRTVTSDLADVVRDSDAAQDAIIAAQLPNADDLPMPDTSDEDDDPELNRFDALDAIVRRTTEQVTSLSQPIPDEVDRVLKRELIRGVAAGDNPRLVAARMTRRAEARFTGALGLTRALNVARTEILDAHREAAQVGQGRNADVLTGWVWHAHLGPRTCQACIGMHGRVFPLEEPGPYGHQGCRCSRAPRSKSWADLGFEGLDEPDDEMPDADAWFDSLPEADQRAILGRNYEAWAAGDFPRSQWVKRQANDGWRDSHVPAKPGGEHDTDGT